jgi:hypothetical protein
MTPFAALREPTDGKSQGEAGKPGIWRWEVEILIPLKNPHFLPKTQRSKKRRKILRAKFVYTTFEWRGDTSEMVCFTVVF